MPPSARAKLEEAIRTDFDAVVRKWSAVRVQDAHAYHGDECRARNDCGQVQDVFFRL
jgi:hypothetical protein